MARRKTSRYPLSVEYMQEKLIQWNPHWSVDDIKSWSKSQLYAIYLKEQKKVVQSIYSHYGLTY